MTPQRLTSRAEITRFLKFSAVGTLGLVIDLGLVYVLHDRLGVPAVAAQMVSFSAAVTSNFIWNRYWTYPDSRSKSLRRQATQFAIVSVIGLSIRTPIFAALLGPYTEIAASLLSAFPGVAVTASRLGVYMALMTVIVIVFFWNFLANRLWTYADAGRVPAGTAAQRADTPPV